MGVQYQPIVKMESDEVPDGWLFNIRQDNWPACEAGPESGGGHDEEHVGNPWHGIKTTSGALPADITPGDVAFVRRATRLSDGSPGPHDHGVMGIWRFHENTRVRPDMEIPWDGGARDYQHVIYCREDPELPRSLDEPLIENFRGTTSDSAAPFDQSSMQDSLKRLSGMERAQYVEHLIDTNPDAPAEIKRALQTLVNGWESDRF